MINLVWLHIQTQADPNRNHKSQKQTSTKLFLHLFCCGNLAEEHLRPQPPSSSLTREPHSVNHILSCAVNFLLWPLTLGLKRHSILKSLKHLFSVICYLLFIRATEHGRCPLFKFSSRKCRRRGRTSFHKPFGSWTRRETA